MTRVADGCQPVAPPPISPRTRVAWDATARAYYVVDSGRVVGDVHVTTGPSVEQRATACHDGFGGATARFVSTPLGFAEEHARAWLAERLRTAYTLTEDTYR